MKYLILLFLLFSAILANAQTYYYIGKSGNVVSTKDSADFIRLVKGKDSVSGLYPIIDYYLSGKIKTRASYGDEKDFLFEGQKIDYFENGKKQKAATYTKGTITGEVYYFYPNGFFYYSGLPNTTIRRTFDQQEVFVNAAKDSTGKEMVVDGTGYFIKYADNFKDIIVEGNLLKSIWNGEVKGFMERDSIHYVEQMEQGKLVSGISTDKNGNTYQYKYFMTSPEYPGGQDAFRQYLGNSIRIPRELAHLNLNGDIRTTFTIDSTGEVVDPLTIKGLNPLMDETVRNVFKRSKKWVPGAVRGVPGRFTFTIPTKIKTSEGDKTSPLEDGIPKRRN